MSSKIVEFQAAAVQYLAGLPDLSGVPVLDERKGDIVNRVTQAVNVTNGICVLFLTPTAGVKYANAPGPVLEVKIVLVVTEKPVINASGFSALEVCETCLAALHHWTAPGSSACVYAEDPATLQLVPDDTNVIYNVNLHTEIFLGAE